MGAFLLLLAATRASLEMADDPCMADPCHETADCYHVGGPENHGGGVIEAYCLCKEGGGEVPIGESCLATDEGEIEVKTCQDEPCPSGHPCVEIEFYPHHVCLPPGKPMRIEDLPPSPCEGPSNPCHDSAFCDTMYTGQNTVEAVCICENGEEVEYGAQCEAATGRLM